MRSAWTTLAAAESWRDDDDEESSSVGYSDGFLSRIGLMRADQTAVDRREKWRSLYSDAGGSFRRRWSCWRVRGYRRPAAASGRRR